MRDASGRNRMIFVSHGENGPAERSERILSTEGDKQKQKLDLMS